MEINSGTGNRLWTMVDPIYTCIGIRRWRVRVLHCTGFGNQQVKISALGSIYNRVRGRPPPRPTAPDPLHIRLTMLPYG